MQETGMIYCVALPFQPVEGGGFAPGQAVECAHASAAVRTRPGDGGRHGQYRGRSVLAQGEPDIGEFEDAVILKAFGDVPEDFISPVG
jgi:hypothetical protein